MKKWLLTALVAVLVCVGCTCAMADPIITNGSYVSYLGEENHLFLINPEGTTMTLRSTIVDLVGMDDTQMYCLTAEGRLYSIKLDGSATNIVSAAPTEEDLANVASTPVYTLAEDGTLNILSEDGQTTTTTVMNVIAACRNSTHVYFITKGTSSNNLSRVAIGGTMLEDISSAPDAPLSVFASDDAVVMVAGDHSLIRVDLTSVNYDSTYYAATSENTIAAVSIGDQLYRFTNDENGSHYLLEGSDAVSTSSAQSSSDEQKPTVTAATATSVPTAAPTATATPRVTAKPTATPKTTSSTDDDDTLRYGDTGSAVRKMQKRLIELGYPLDKADGVYGEKTRLAVKLFQSTIGYHQRNYATKSMQNKLYAKTAPVFDYLVEVKVGDKGARVLLLQTTLKEKGFDPGKLDGVFGENTTNAIIAYQASIGLPQTGLADVTTLINLYEVPVETPTPAPTTPATQLSGSVSIASTASAGDTLAPTISLNAASSTYVYNWFKDGVALGVTTSTITVDSSMAGSKLMLMVTSADVNYTGSVFSNECVVAGSSEPTATPTAADPTATPTAEPTPTATPTADPTPTPTPEPATEPSTDPNPSTDTNL
jgi:peptidoglycan hydrolase-like protein with peptidoglycan-binding domain